MHAVRTMGSRFLVAALVAGSGLVGCGSDSDASGDPMLPDAGQSDGGSDDGAGCVVKSCAQLAAQCGSLPDNCGGKIECGECPDGQICGGAGANQCGTNECYPKSCAQLGASCGWASDQCSEAIACGDCPSGQTCGGSGIPNVCEGGSGACQMTLENVDSDLTLPAGCVVDVPGPEVSVDNSATLTIEEGVKLRMGPGTKIWVALDGAAKIVVQGTAAEPVVFTSSSSSPAAGDWGGLYLGGDLMGGTSFDYATFEYAGDGGTAAVEVGAGSQPGRVSITNCTFRHNSSGALQNDYGGDFKAMTGNHMTDNEPWSMKIEADFVGSVGSGNTFETPIRVSTISFAPATVSKSATWLKHDVPYWLEKGLKVDDGSLPVLTLESDVEIRFGMGQGLQVGTQYGGSLQATNVRFTSAAPSASPGDWEVIRFGDAAGASSLSGCTIEYGGQSDYYSVLTVHTDAVSKVAVTGTTFANNAGTSNIDTGGGDCSKYENATPVNTFDLSTPCE